MYESTGPECGRGSIIRLKGLFSLPPLVIGEDGRDYEALDASFRAAIRPTDAIEEVWMQDCIDLHWEIMRLRHAKAVIISISRKEALAKIFERIAPFVKDESLTRAEQGAAFAEQWVADKETRAKLCVLLSKFELDPESAMWAEAIALRVGEMEGIERMINSLERRRDMIRQQIDDRREATAQRRLHAQAPDVDRSIRGAPVPILEHRSSSRE